MFFKHFVGKNQLPGFYISGTLVENGLMLSENSVQSVLLEHSVQTVLKIINVIQTVLIVIKVNREFKLKKTRCYKQIQSKHNANITQINNSFQIGLKGTVMQIT